jgi:hypothetical protein
MADVPEPVTGGTWIYCRHSWRERSGGGITHYTCLARFRRAKKYRQHWRRHHG